MINSLSNNVKKQKQTKSTINYVKIYNGHHSNLVKASVVNSKLVVVEKKKKLLCKLPFIIVYYFLQLGTQLQFICRQLVINIILKIHFLY